jgi:cytochrome c oxidase subunit 2
MVGWVVVMSPEDYENWLAGGAQAAKPPAEAGADLFAATGCNTCHVEAGGGRAPSLRGLFGSTVQLTSGQTVVADASYIRRSILEPPAQVVAGYQPIMPTYKGQISEENLFKLIAYIRSLGSGETAPAAVPSPAQPAAASAAAPGGSEGGSR